VSTGIKELMNEIPSLGMKVPTREALLPSNNDAKDPSLIAIKKMPIKPANRNKILTEKPAILRKNSADF